jgi:hypothetical protein
MRYNKYAMPVHRKVLEQDFENTVDIDTLNEIYYTLKGKQLNDIPEDTLRKIVKYLEEAWFAINYKQGINLRDREKLIPVFSEFNRIFKGRQQTNKAYRGVRLSNFDPNALSRTYPNSIKDPEVLEHLEGLAYGLRSWSGTRSTALDWATNKTTSKDMVVFEIDDTNIVLDSLDLSLFLIRNFRTTFIDFGEIVLNIKNPKILDITQSIFNNKNYYTVKIKDMG